MRLLLTGCSGFIGRALFAELTRRGHSIRCAVRQPTPGIENAFVVGDLSGVTRWSAAVAGCDVVIHLAAHVHKGKSAVDQDAFQRVNVDATRSLVSAAVSAGVGRFVFVSSAKVMGESSGARPFVEGDTPRPQDAYGRSKLAAEQALATFVGALEITIVRPPLVYGPGVRANFLSLLRLADSPWPLPLAAATARRSLVFVGNLVDALIACATVRHLVPATYFVSDGNDLSVAELVTQLRAANGVRARLWPIPAAAASALAALVGQRDVAQRLFAPLQIDASRIRRELGWTPPFVQRDALALTARSFRSTRAPAAS